ncbi:MAG: hypothetical protein DRO11_07760, partial [Methanobacteriota archaeon]
SEIEELARALKHDPRLIFDHVRNHIDHVPTFGSVNGATATILAGRGNDFDQASLFIALMRASGYTANYVCGDVTYALADMAGWLGVDAIRNVVGNVLSSGGIPVTVYTNDYVKITRVWARANIGGTDYIFDPAFKKYERVAGINLAQAMGYSQFGFLASAKESATIGTDFVKDMNEVNIKGNLQTYSNNLVSWIKANKPNACTRKTIGGLKIIQEEINEYPSELPCAVQVENTTQWTGVPDNYRLKLRIQHKGIDHTFFSYEIAGKRVSIFYTGSNNAPELRVEGTLVATGNSTTPGFVYDLDVSVDHPYAGNNGQYCDQDATFKLKSGSSYVIAHDFEGVSKDLIGSHNTVLTENRHSGAPDDSETVLGETLCIMGLTWLHECRLSERLMAQLAEIAYVHHHSVGVMAQEEGYYIDVKMSLVSPVSIHDDQGDARAWFRAMSGVGSAFEHGMLEQLQGKEKPGASTVKLLQISNSNSKKTFYADSGNFGTIQGQLQNYTPDQIAQLQGAVNDGYKLILPEDAHIVLNEWQGVGYIQAYSDEQRASVGMIISGDYNGGYSGSQGDVNIDWVEIVSTVNIPDVSTRANISPPVSVEPVDLASGAYLHDRTDLSVGRGEPLGLHFTRSYNSSNNYTKRDLGYGWSHNYNIFLECHSHGDPGLGERLPIDAVSAIAGFYIAFDLMKDHDDLEGWVVSSLVHKWAIDQLIDNAETIHLGSKTLEYIKLADGTYSPPPGVTIQMIDNGDGTFSLRERFGTRLDFDAEDRISQWADVDGNTMAFTYSGDKLSSVQDALGRTLTLGYSGDLIQTVSDSSGRSVSYGYDGNENLITYTDPEGKVWGHGYDVKHRMTTLTNPLSITTATNTYDSLGRVDTQTVPIQGEGNATYNFYFSGFRNMEEDPEGNQTIYYFDEKGRTIGVENALGHKATMEYDGQNHLILSTDPRMNSTSFKYDGDNNLSGTTNALNYVTRHTYDDQFRLTDVIDPLGHSSHFDYDQEHHLIRTTVYPESGKTIETGASYYANGLT